MSTTKLPIYAPSWTHRVIRNGALSAGLFWEGLYIMVATFAHRQSTILAVASLAAFVIAWYFERQYRNAVVREILERLMQ